MEKRPLKSGLYLICWDDNYNTWTAVFHVDLRVIRTCCELAENEMTPPGLLAPPVPPNEKLGVVLKENPPATTN